MKKLALPIALLLVSGLAYAKGKPLADKQLDKISAGSAVADGESTATDSRSFSVNLSGSALGGASSLNIVNAANSDVANATNVWNANLLNDVGTVDQTNDITQDLIPCDCGQLAAGSAVSATTGGGPMPETEADVATANAIALDGSTARVSFSESVTLSGTAEANAKALNIVNAVGSLVADAANIASSTNMHNLGTLVQTNVITQVGH